MELSIETLRTVKGRVGGSYKYITYRTQRFLICIDCPSLFRRTLVTSNGDLARPVKIQLPAKGLSQLFHCSEPMDQNLIATGQPQNREFSHRSEAPCHFCQLVARRDQASILIIWACVDKAVRLTRKSANRLLISGLPR
jgi:hypothetical protein